MTDYYDPMFFGTDTWWKHPLWDVIYTDSVKHFAEEYQAWWTVDVVGSYMPQFKKYDFLVLTFDVDNGSCVFTAKEDSDRKPIVTQDIPYTDLTVSIKLFYENGVLLFPSDH